MSTALATHSINDMQVMAESIAKSGLFGMKSYDQALALILVAQSEGQHPATITQDYDIIQGKACRKTHSVMARFQQMGGKVEWHELTGTVADATFSHASGGSVRMKWTIEQAKAAGLTNKDNWKNYPRAMLRARTIAEGIRTVYPAAIGGMLLTEEAQDLPPQVERDMGAAEVIDGSTGEITKPEPQTLVAWPQEAFEAAIKKHSPNIINGTKTPADLIAWMRAKGSLTPAQEAAVNAIKAAPVSGEVMTEAEIAEAKRRELQESQRETT